MTISCSPDCVACLRSDWDFFQVRKHQPAGLPECVKVLEIGDKYDGFDCICQIVQEEGDTR